MTERTQPGVYVSGEYRGRLPLNGPLPGDAVAVGIVINKGEPMRWMTDEEYRDFAKLAEQSERTGA